MLKAAGGGAIVNLSSAAGRFGYAFRTPYSAAKWGVIGFTQSLAKELGPANIRVNAILPGIVEGPRMSGVIDARAKQTGVTYAEMEKTYLDRISLRRMVTAARRRRDGRLSSLAGRAATSPANRSASTATSRRCDDGGVAEDRGERDEQGSDRRFWIRRPRLGDQLRPRRPRGGAVGRGRDGARKSAVLYRRPAARS